MPSASCSTSRFQEGRPAGAETPAPVKSIGCVAVLKKRALASDTGYAKVCTFLIVVCMFFAGASYGMHCAGHLGVACLDDVSPCRLGSPVSVAEPSASRLLPTAAAAHNAGYVRELPVLSSASAALAQAISLIDLLRPHGRLSPHPQHVAPATPATENAGIKAGMKRGCRARHPMQSTG